MDKLKDGNSDILECPPLSELYIAAHKSIGKDYRKKHEFHILTCEKCLIYYLENLRDKFMQ